MYLNAYFICAADWVKHLGINIFNNVDRHAGYIV